MYVCHSSARSHHRRNRCLLSVLDCHKSQIRGITPSLYILWIFISWWFYFQIVFYMNSSSFPSNLRILYVSLSYIDAVILCYHHCRNMCFLMYILCLMHHWHWTRSRYRLSCRCCFPNSCSYSRYCVCYECCNRIYRIRPPCYFTFHITSIDYSLAC